jgi:hypothetical protein
MFVGNKSEIWWRRMAESQKSMGNVMRTLSDNIPLEFHIHFHSSSTLYVHSYIYHTFLLPSFMVIVALVPHFAKFRLPSNVIIINLCFNIINIRYAGWLCMINFLVGEWNEMKVEVKENWQREREDFNFLYSVCGRIC